MTSFILTWLWKIYNCLVDCRLKKTQNYNYFLAQSASVRFWSTFSIFVVVSLHISFTWGERSWIFRLILACCLKFYYILANIVRILLMKHVFRPQIIVATQPNTFWIWISVLVDKSIFHAWFHYFLLSLVFYQYSQICNVWPSISTTQSNANNKK